ncbi:MAG: hypothetical protein A4E53_01641 [Pelotomaculum sp. PtaB.Bin104]|jgi:ribosomal protein S27AE|nr:MAG: hypothetical protein A4E53_01641 [Pelotomaculum sp. PtaB.Bin104]
MDKKWYETHTEKVLKGKKCVSLYPLKNGWCTLPEGTVYTITRKYQGLNLTSDKCPHCGAQQHISRVSYRDIQMLPKQPFDINSDSAVERGEAPK